jgi:hypothetical protein
MFLDVNRTTFEIASLLEISGVSKQQSSRVRKDQVSWKKLFYLPKFFRKFKWYFIKKRI